VLVERLGRRPLLDQDDRFLLARALVDVAGGAPLLSPDGSLDGTQQFQHLVTSVRRRQDPDGPTIMQTVK